MVNADLINAGDFEKITALCKEAMYGMLGFEMAHVGINTENEEAALKTANRFSFLFGFQNNPGKPSIYSGPGIEVMKTLYLGRNGHIGIRTNSLLRARAYFERQGIEFNQESERLDENGKVRLVYFKEEIGGFAVHLAQKK